MLTMNEVQKFTNWLSPPNHLFLNNNELHIWRAIWDDSFVNSLSHFMELLSNDELNRAKKYHFERDRQKFIFWRGSFKSILSKYVNISAPNIQFNYNSYGKPSLKNVFFEKSVQFNISHSQSVAIYAFTFKDPVGIDIEYMRTDFDWQPIAQQFFTARENETLQKAESSTQAFYYHWTRKEAIVKALGKGLYIPLSDIDIAQELIGSHRVDRRYRYMCGKQCWYIFDINAQQGYCASVVVPFTPSSILYFDAKMP
jgi:4'-phosphopantetheinyl transferase